MNEPALLVVMLSDDTELQQTLAGSLARWRFELRWTHQPEQSLTELRAREVAVLLVDTRLLALDVLTFLASVRQQAPQTEVVLITTDASPESALDAAGSGAFDCLGLPLPLDGLRLALEKIRYRWLHPQRTPLPLMSFDEAHRRLLEAALRRTKGNRSQTAALLGISRPTLYRLLEKFGLTAPAPTVRSFRENGPEPDRQASADPERR